MQITLIVFLPLAAALLVGLNSRRMSYQAAQLFTCSFMCVSAVLSAFVFHDVVIKQHSYTVDLFNWVTSGGLNVKWALQVDPLTAVMLIVVSWVSALVHIYSVGYMSHDEHKQRFMAYLSLFTFFMLMLVTSDNFLQLFLGWEGVGLCSYLLIGFWYKRQSACNAAIKAFIVNRVGDFGFALGIFAIFMIFGSIQFSEVFTQAESLRDKKIEFLGNNFHAITMICILLFIGAMGKSAQLGLHTWLPDAMEGPTPVSALIHAATMVTAGVFMVARCSPLFELSPLALQIVTIVGALTCFFAATVAITQNDIKRVIAYSTCSQLGYMFFACGVSAYAAGIFHLMTHGFFKALLFLGAGSVIHAMSNEQDMRKMGGIWRLIPFTYAMMIIGTLAITGFPLLSGYYSKDIILESAFAAGHEGNKAAKLAFWLGIISATFTAFYSWRLIFMTFHGKPRADEETMHHIHESPKIMTVPLLLLAIGAIFAGGFAFHKLGIVDHDMGFWNGSIKMEEKVFNCPDTSKTGDCSSLYYNVLEKAHHVPSWVKFAPMVVGIIGFVLAFMLYIKNTTLPQKIAAKAPAIYKFLFNKWYFDELYDAIFVRPAKKLGYLLWRSFDIGVIDRLGPDGLSALSQKIATRLSKIQTGYVYHYAFVMLIGVVGLLGWFIVK